MLTNTKVSICIGDHTLNCNECKGWVKIENASPRVLAGTKQLVFLCGECDKKDRSQFPVSALYN